MFRYQIYKIENIDIHIILINNYRISIKFYPIINWCIYLKYFVDKNVLCIYLPTLDIVLNKNEKY